MSLYETQEPLDDTQGGPHPGIAEHELDEPLTPSVAAGSSPKFHVFYHSYRELYRRSYELLQYARGQVSDEGNKLLESVSDEIQNQKSCLSTIDEYLKNVWVCFKPVFLDQNVVARSAVRAVHLCAFISTHAYTCATAGASVPR